MKTVLNIENFKVMKNYIKYICAIFLLLGTSASAWSVTITLKAWDKSTSTYVNVGTFEKGEQPGSGPGSYSDTYLTTLAWAPGTQTTDTSFPTNGGNNNGSTYWNQYGFPTSNYNGNATELYAVYYYGGYYTTAPDVQFSEIVGCTQYDIVYGVSGSGGSNPTGDATACEDATVTFTPDPSTGYAYNGATVYLSNLETVHASLDANTTSFTMPDEDVYVYVSYTAQSYIVTLDNQDATSGGTDKIIVTYGASTNLTGTAITVPTKTGYEFGGYYTSSNGGGNLVINSSGMVQAEVETEDGQDYLTSEDKEWLYASGITLYAKWTANTTTITLDKGSGGYSDGGALIDYDDLEATIVTAATNTTTGYHLEGYFTNDATPVKVLNADGSFAANNVTGYVTSGKWSNESAEITLYAHWALNTYTVHFNKNDNDATGSMGDQVFTYGTAQNLTSCGFSLAGKIFDGWATTAGGEKAYNNGAEVNNLTTTNEATVNLFAKWRTGSYTDAKFSCADWSLTGPSGDIVFITSAASKTVRSQEAFHVSGSGLPHSTALTFTTFPVNAKFEFKKADGSGLATDEYGKVNTDFYVFYTPDEGDTSDGLDEITTLYVSVEGEPRKGTLDTKTIIGRHLPANFVIAVKHDDNQWYALPADMSGTGNPAPVVIRVDNTSSPTTAYCDNTNAYSLYASTVNNSSVQLAMPNNPYMANAALWANNADKSTNIGKNGNTNGSSTGLGANYQWLFTQTATSVSGIGDVKYTMSNPNNANSLKVWTNAGSTLWGLYSSGSAEIRLLSMEVVKPLSLKVMEWGTNAIVVSYPNGSSATSPQVRIGDGEAANVTLTSLGGDIYKIATISGLQSNPANTLVFTATESSVAKQIALAIPLIVSDAKTELELRSAVPGANLTEKNKVAKLTDVIIRDGGRLTTGTASGNFNDVYIYPGGKAKITNNFAAKNIYMRGGYSFLDEKASFYYPDLCVESPATIDLPAAGKLYYDFYIDNRIYYMFSMPYDVALANVTDEAGNEDFPVWVKHYDGALRASGHGVTGWTWYGDDPGQGSFFAGIGYEITAKPKISGRPIAIVRFPVISTDITTDASHSPEVTVTYYGKSAYEAGTQSANNVGWNFIGNPYLTEYKAVTDTSMIVKSDFVEHIVDGRWDGTYDWKETSARFITVPYDTYNDYHHELVKGYTIPAFSTFFFQYADGTNGTFHMGGTRPQAALTPARFGVKTEATPERNIDILLRGEDEIEGKAGLIIHDKYEGGLKDFEDVEQWFVDKNVQKTYTFADGVALAYNLLNEEAIKELIPMGYIATVAGEHTYSLNEENDVRGLDHLWLYDYETGETTDLLVRDYLFYTSAGRFDNRFAINAVFKQEEVATDVTNVGDDDWTRTLRLFREGNTLTLRGLADNSTVYVYDMTGKLVYQVAHVSNVTSFNIPSQGVYNIRVIGGGEAVTLRTVLR